MIVMSLQVDPNNQHHFTIEGDHIELRIADHQGMVRLYGTPEQWEKLFQSGMKKVFDLQER